MQLSTRSAFAVDIEFLGVKIASCSECGRGIELESPVHADLSLWCDVCWSSWSEEQKQAAVAKRLPFEKKALAARAAESLNAGG